jgi:hypothetical protein
MSGVKKQVKTPFSRPSQSSEFASKKKIRSAYLNGRELRLLDVPYLQCTYGEIREVSFVSGPRRSHRQVETITIVMWAV